MDPIAKGALRRFDVRISLVSLLPRQRTPAAAGTTSGTRSRPSRTAFALPPHASIDAPQRGARLCPSQTTNLRERLILLSLSPTAGPLGEVPGAGYPPRVHPRRPRPRVRVRAAPVRHAHAPREVRCPRGGFGLRGTLLSCLASVSFNDGAHPLSSPCWAGRRAGSPRPRPRRAPWSSRRSCGSRSTSCSPPSSREKSFCRRTSPFPCRVT